MTSPPWLEIAWNELGRGVSEVGGDELDNARIVEYHRHTTLQATNDEVAWCSSFACACMDWGGYRSPNSARARSWLAWGVGLQVPPHGAVCVIQRGRRPQPGPEVLKAKGHVGFYVGTANPREILLLGGNQGNEVSVKAYPKERVLGYRWPQWVTEGEVDV